jgi:hypothetical protein
MKKIIFFTLFICVVSNLNAQTEAISPTYSFNITKKVIPPMLSLDANDISFEDEDGNGIINANEKCRLHFTLNNEGQGDGLNLQAKLVATGSTQGIQFSPTTPVSKVISKQQVSGTIEFQSNMSTINGKVILDLEIEEPNGFNSDKVQIELQTAAFLAPNIKVVDYTLASVDGSSTLELGKKIELELLIQNTGQGSGNKISIELHLPENTLWLDGNELSLFIDHMDPGEEKILKYVLIMNKKFTGSELMLEAVISEVHKKYAHSWKGNFALKQNLSVQRLVVEGRIDSPKAIEEASLRSDVDKDIPLGIPQGQKRYALIIGNEDYAKYQTGLDQEVNVAFARNDADIMAQYVERTLGFSKQNVVVLKDATKGQMSQEIAKLLRYAELGKGESEILFYYSGHGLPEEVSKEPFLIPVDVSGSQVTNGYSLNELYGQLAQHPTKKCTVILDACFSGGARNKELVAMKGVKVKASVSNVPSNLVVMTSSSGQESSAVFKDKQHGLFTYYLLQSLKASKGLASYQTTMNEVTEKVALEATRMNKIQTPQLLMGGLVQSKIGTLGWGN